MAVDGGAKRKDGGSGGDAAGAGTQRPDTQRPSDEPDARVPGEGGDVLKLLAGGPGGPGSVDGVGTNVRFHMPHGIALDSGHLYVSDMYNCTIRKVVIATGEVTTLAGLPEVHGSSDGIGSEARFHSPDGLASDGAGLNLFVADVGNHAVRRIALGTRIVSTVVGTLGRQGLRLGPLPAGLSGPAGLALDSTGQLFVTLAEENAILAARF